jgi:protein gp37
VGENSGISWTDHTVNFWWGCTKVSPACAHCYAESQATRFHHRVDGSPLLWGADSQRLVRIKQARLEALRYDRKAAAQGIRFRVFTNSMADFFEDRPDLAQARLEALEVIRSTPNLDWLILTKRPERVMDLLNQAFEAAMEGPTLWHKGLVDWLALWIFAKRGAPANVWLGTTAENQEWADKRIPALLQAPARVRFVSMEPLLGPVDLGGEYLADVCGGRYPFPGLEDQFRTKRIDRLDWVIVGGESGPHARPMHPDWARGLRDQCAAAGVPFHFKQWGTWSPYFLAVDEDARREVVKGLPGGRMWRQNAPTKAAAGRLLDGRLHDAFPEVAP